MTATHAEWLDDAIAELKRTMAAGNISAVQRLHADRLLCELENELIAVRPAPTCCASMPAVKANYFIRYDYSRRS